MIRNIVVASVVLVVGLGYAPSAASDAAAVDYGDGGNWLCRPGREDACAVDLAATVVAADGSLTREAFAADPDAPIDCFYVYPTVSSDPTPNSDMTANAAERRVIRAQFARFASVCRPFAPLYRQVTLTALRAGMSGKPMAVDRGLGYGDVVGAWQHYLEHDNDGRGVVLIGHSQGTGVLTRLIAQHIDGQPVQDRLLSALLLGTSGVTVPPGEDVGGTFNHVPLCRAADQVGCVITYASFRADAPPPADSFFGRPRGGQGTSACTNPARLEGGSGTLEAYLSAGGASIASSSDPHAWVQPPVAIDTPFVKVPGLLSAECVSGNGRAWLAVTVHGDPGDPRTDDIAGDVVIDGTPDRRWGLHLIDVHLAIGNLIEIVRAQTAAYLGR